MRLAAAIAALALLTTACGSDEGGGGSDPVGLLAAAIAHADGSESYESEFDLRSTLGPSDISAFGRSISNPEGTIGRGPVEYRDGADAMEFEIIVIEGNVWIRSAQLRRALPRGKIWVRARDESLAQQSLTPDQLVDLLRDSPSVEEVGRENVRGEPTVVLRGPLDLKTMADRLEAGPLKRLVDQQPEAIAGAKLVAEIWIGEDERARRIAVKLTIDGVRGEMTMRSDILRYDVSLDSVKAPPESEVVDEQDLGSRR